MTHILEVNAQGELRVPSELLKHAKPRKRYLLEVDGDTLILHPEQLRPLWATATPTQRAEAFRTWAMMPRPSAPTLPDEALRRENIYN